MDSRLKWLIACSVVNFIGIIAIIIALAVPPIRYAINSYSQLKTDETIPTNPCEDGWELYKEEKCLKIFFDAGLLNYTNAESFCKGQKGSHLISIDGGEKQEFVQEFLKRNSVTDSAWIGLNYVNSIYQWADGTQSQYTNWASGSPKNDKSYCVRMQVETANFGLWSDTLCEKNNSVVCERIQQWSSTELQIKMMNMMRNSVHQSQVSNVQFLSLTNSVEQLISNLTDLRTEVGNLAVPSLAKSVLQLNSKLTDLQTDVQKLEVPSLAKSVQQLNSNLTVLRTDVQNLQVPGLAKSVQQLTSNLMDLRTNVQNLEVPSLAKSMLQLNSNLTDLRTHVRNSGIPISFIYVQLPKEMSPQTLWPLMKWKDISSQYAGLFFRTEGGNAASFGKIQNANSPRLVSMLTSFDKGASVEVNITANNEYSKSLDLDCYYNRTHTHWGLKLKLSGGEVRPVNMVIRIWKRIA